MAAKSLLDIINWIKILIKHINLLQSCGVIENIYFISFNPRYLWKIEQKHFLNNIYTKYIRNEDNTILRVHGMSIILCTFMSNTLLKDCHLTYRVASEYKNFDLKFIYCFWIYFNTIK